MRESIKKAITAAGIGTLYAGAGIGMFYGHQFNKENGISTAHSYVHYNPFGGRGIEYGGNKFKMKNEQAINPEESNNSVRNRV